MDGCAQAIAVLRYLNRLSKFMFVAARFFAAVRGECDVPYQKAKPSPAQDKQAPQTPQKRD